MCLVQQFSSKEMESVTRVRILERETERQRQRDCISLRTNAVPLVKDKLLDILGSLSLGRLPVEKNKTKFKLARLGLKIDLVSYPAHTGGFG